MSVEQSIQIFTICFRISIVIMVLGITFSIFIFFKCRIPTIYALMTGRIRKKTVEEMQRSGMLRSPEELEAEGYSTFSETSEQPDQSVDYSTETLDQYSGMPQADKANPFQEIADFTALKAAAETTLLQNQVETTLLKSAEETTVLKGSVEAPVTDIEDETLLLKPETAKPVNFHEKAGLTERLDHGPTLTDEISGKDDPGTTVLKGKFETIEHTMIIHTEQVI